jgi:hypothetical protein
LTREDHYDYVRLDGTPARVVSSLHNHQQGPNEDEGSQVWKMYAGPRSKTAARAATSNRRTSDDNSNRLLPSISICKPEMRKNGFSDLEPSRTFKKERRMKPLYVGTNMRNESFACYTGREAHDFCLLPTAHWHEVASGQHEAASPSQSEPKTRSQQKND